MRKIKLVIVIILILMVNVLLHSFVYAEDITAEQVVTSTDGSIDYILKGLNLEEGANYKWAIEKTKGVEIENWYDVLNPDYASGTIRISILATNDKQLSVLKSTNTGYLTIKKENGDNIISDYSINLELPLLKAFTISKSMWYDRKVSENPGFVLKTIYGINGLNAKFKWEKITDPNIVNKYIDNNHDLSGLSLKGKESFPSLTDTSWKSFHKNMADGTYLKNGEIPTEDGLYYLWLQASDTNVKTIYGQAIIEVGNVTKITNNNGSDKETSSDKNNSNGTTEKESTSDPTIAKKILPNTGISIAIMGSILLVAIIGVAFIAKYYKYKDVK